MYLVLGLTTHSHARAHSSSLHDAESARKIEKNSPATLRSLRYRVPIHQSLTLFLQVMQHGRFLRHSAKSIKSHKRQPPTPMLFHLRLAMKDLNLLLGSNSRPTLTRRKPAQDPSTTILITTALKNECRPIHIDGKTSI